MAAPQEVRLELVFEKQQDGRYYVKSSDLPGFRLAGTDFDALHRDLDHVVSDLLLYNSNFIVESLRWVPTIAEVKQHLQKPGPEGRALYVVSGTIAA
jgi:hypothetical protein